MVMFIVSVVAGTIIIMLASLIISPFYFLAKFILRMFLLLIGIDTYTEREKINLGLLKIEEILTTPTKSTEELEEPTTSNCILSKNDFPNIEKYFPGYKEKNK